MRLASFNADDSWMQHALGLAAKGRGSVEPNPMVGCVIVRDGKIIGEGYHAFFGGPHAEPNALAACIATQNSAPGATAYVTLEPCSHTDKKTPPCVPALIAAKLARVVIGCLDPNPKVAGQGAEQLKAAGIETVVGVLKHHAMQLNAAYFARTLHHRPYVTLKWAESADGKVAGPGGARRAISNHRTMRVMHALRARCDAILVGIRTAITDDPVLLARLGNPMRQPLRVVLDSQLDLPVNGALAITAHNSPVLVYCSASAYAAKSNKLVLLRRQEVEVAPLAGEANHLELQAVLADLCRRNVTHLLIEPGPNLARAFLHHNLADRLWVQRSPMRIGDATAPTAERVDYPAIAEVNLDDDVLTEYLNPASDVYFSPDASADLDIAAET
jgi:diaminohydroxyphosphoribosylaminopyrimidine deaminase/5-amino-6-(5-phosphoribosylamino)uracil reductase